MGGVSEFRLTWTSPGPEIDDFMAARGRVAGIEGPFGSGKTSAILVKPMFLALQAHPSPQDGVRRYRHVMVRDTYRQLWRTTIPSWWHWVGQDVGDWTGSKDGPATHQFRINTSEGPVDYQVDFCAIGDNAAEDVLRGYETTSFGLDEADRLAWDVYYYARGRAGRYPRMDDGGPAWYGVMLAFNSPEWDSWLDKRITEGHWRPGIEYFKQPPGMIKRGGKLVVNPKANNLSKLPKGYYQNQIEDAPQWYIDRMVLCKRSHSRTGKPIFPEFNDDLHVAGEALEPIAGRPLGIGMDAGLSPAGIIGQQAANGQWLILDEVVPGAGTGTKRFSQALLQILEERYPDWLRSLEEADPRMQMLKAWADPSAAYGTDKDPGAGEKTWIEIVQAETGITTLPAPGDNRLVARHDAVRGPLTRLIDGQHPGVLISPRCVMIRKGMAAGYKWGQINTADGERTITEPVKNEYSHPADGLQYLLLGAGEYQTVMGRKQVDPMRHAQSRALTDERPGGEYRDFGRQRVGLR